MSLSHVTSSPKRSVSSYALSGKDTNLSATSDELTATIVSLTSTIKKLKELLLAAATAEDEWNKRGSKVKDLLDENGVKPFLFDSRKEELEDLLSRAQNYARSSVDAAAELVTEIKTFESHLAAAQEAKNKIAKLLVTKKLDVFPKREIASPSAARTDNAKTREIRSVIATAQALISLREGK